MPAVPAKAEAMRMASFAVARWAGSLKANEAMKIDIVKPIPASTPNPTI